MSKDRFKIVQRPGGVKRVTIDLKPGENLMLIEPDSHYKLGGQIDDVMASHVLEEARKVTWSSHEQQWIE